MAKLETEKIIKGRVAEAIAEEIFKELKFFVMKLGKEHTANPLDQLKDFVNVCGGKFELEKLGMEIREISHINVLPDFILVCPNGKVQLLEIKFRYNAELYDKDLLVFKTYPEAHMLVINTEVSDNIPEISQKNAQQIEELKNSHFHIWTRKNDSENGKISKEVMNLTEWLKKDFNIEPQLVKDLLLGKYEKLVNYWLGKSKEIFGEVK